MFVQGGNSLIFITKDEEERQLIVNSTGRKWEFTFTTLVTFGGAFFASFPLFYSTSFGGAYWVWILLLVTFVFQAVSYEFQTKLGNLLGRNTFRTFLLINGCLGPFIVGAAVSTFFTGSDFIVNKAAVGESLAPCSCRWRGSGGSVVWSCGHYIGHYIRHIRLIFGNFYYFCPEACHTESRPVPVTQGRSGIQTESVTDGRQVIYQSIAELIGLTRL